jgi:hypothetical protein
MKVFWLIVSIMIITFSCKKEEINQVDDVFSPADSLKWEVIEGEYLGEKHHYEWDSWTPDGFTFYESELDTTYVFYFQLDVAGDSVISLTDSGGVKICLDWQIEGNSFNYFRELEQTFESNQWDSLAIDPITNWVHYHSEYHYGDGWSMSSVVEHYSMKKL